MICPKCGNHVVKARIEDTPEGLLFHCCGYLQADSRPEIDTDHAHGKTPHHYQPKAFNPDDYPDHLDPIPCKICHEPFIPSHNTGKYCDACSEVKGTRRWRAKQPHVPANYQGRSC